MKYRYLPLVAAMAAFSIAGAQISAAQDDDMVVTGLLKMSLDDLAGKESNVVLFEVGPDWEIANHFHPGHIFIYILEGSITIDAVGQEAQTFGPGDVAYEIPDVHMVANNISSTEGAKFVVFTIGDAGDPVTIFVE